MDMVVLYDGDKEPVEILCEWIPDGQFEWSEYIPNEKLSFSDKEPCQIDSRIERVELNRKIVVDRRYLCRMGFSNARGCFLVSCFGTVILNENNEVDVVQGKVDVNREARAGAEPS